MSDCIPNVNLGLQVPGNHGSCVDLSAFDRSHLKTDMICCVRMFIFVREILIFRVVLCRFCAVGTPKLLIGAFYLYLCYYDFNSTTNRWILPGQKGTLNLLFCYKGVLQSLRKDPFFDLVYC